MTLLLIVDHNGKLGEISAEGILYFRRKSARHRGACSREHDAASSSGRRFFSPVQCRGDITQQVPALLRERISGGRQRDAFHVACQQVNTQLALERPYATG